MVWIIIGIVVLVLIGGLLGGMGFFGRNDGPVSRDRMGNNFIDWMM